MARTIHTKEERTAQFIEAGLKVAQKVGIAKTSVAAVAAEAGGEVRGTEEDLRDAGQRGEARLRQDLADLAHGNHEAHFTEAKADTEAKAGDNK